MRAWSIVTALFAFVALFAVTIDAHAGPPPIAFKPPMELAKAANPGPSAPGAYTASLRLTGTDAAGKSWSYDGALSAITQQGFGQLILTLVTPLPAGVAIQGAMIVYAPNDASNPAQRLLLGAPKVTGNGPVTFTYKTMSWTWTKGGVSRTETWTEGG